MGMAELRADLEVAFMKLSMVSSTAPSVEFSTGTMP